MTAPERAFSIGQVLSIACSDTEAHQLFCPYGDILDVLGYMLSDVPGADDLPDAIEECRPAVLEAFPALGEIAPPAPDAPDVAVLAWIGMQEQEHGSAFPLPVIREAPQLVEDA